MNSQRITRLPGRVAVCRLNADDALPSWATGGQFSSVTRTRDELSIVCADERVPPSVRCERGFVLLKVEGPLAFDQVGVLASLAAPIARAGVAIIAIGTFETDYVLVHESNVERAVQALIAEGHRVDGDDVAHR